MGDHPQASSNGQNRQFSYALAIEQGLRSNLEDRIGVKELETAGNLSLLVAIVADGIGGSNCGEIAAERTIETTFSEIAASPTSDPERIPQMLADALQKANQVVFEESKKEREKEGMGTTATVAAVHNNRLFIANVGDSRIYLIRDGQAFQLTRDHTWADEVIRLGKLSSEEALSHYKAQELVRSIGYDRDLEVDLGLYYANGSGVDEEKEAQGNQGLVLQANDRLVLCSDGLIKERPQSHDHFVEESEIAQIVGRYKPEKAAPALVKKALSRQADDNVSAIVLEAPGSKHGFYIPRPVLGSTIGGVILLTLLAIFAFRANGSAGVTSVPTAILESTMTRPPRATLEPGRPVNILVMQPGAGAHWTSGEQQGSIQRGEELPLLATGEPLVMETRDEVVGLKLPDNTLLFLDSDTSVKVLAVAGAYEAVETIIQVDKGRLVLVSQGWPIAVENEWGSRISTAEGTLGVFYSKEPFRFEASCLEETCEVHGDVEGSIMLQRGEATSVGGSGRPEEPSPARYEEFATLGAPYVATPTVMPTASQTITPTMTATATPTSRGPLPPGTTREPSATPSPTPGILVTVTPTSSPQPQDTTEPPPPATNTPPPLATNTPPPLATNTPPPPATNTPPPPATNTPPPPATNTPPPPATNTPPPPATNTPPPPATNTPPPPATNTPPPPSTPCGGPSTPCPGAPP